jgi:hypothetical protein
MEPQAEREDWRIVVNIVCTSGKICSEWESAGVLGNKTFWLN